MGIFKNEKEYLATKYPFIGNQAEVAGIIRAHVRQCPHLSRPIRSGKKLLSYFKYGANSLEDLKAQVERDGYTLTLLCPCLNHLRH